MKDLKTILEGLFDTDLIEQNTEFGSLYELSDTSHHNRISNDLTQIMRCFDKKKLSQQAAKTKYKVDKKNRFVEYWGKDEKILPDLIDVILGMPVQLILSARYESGDKYAQRMALKDEKLVNDYFKKFAFNSKDLHIFVVKYPTKEDTIYDIEFVEGIFDMRPNRLELRFLEK